MTLTKKLLTAGAIAGGAIGALAIYNKMTESMAGELNPVLTGEQRRYPWKYGDMYYEVKGARDARPLLLIHSFGPGASSFEWRKNVDVLAEDFRVYTVDLLGFGLSDHPAIDYTAETYADLINDFMREVINKPTIVAVHGTPGAYVISNAYRRPQLFERLVLVAPPPTMLQEFYPSPLDMAWKSLLRTPILGEFIYNMLSTRRSIYNYFDQQGYHNPGLITDELIEYIFTSSHQPNARYALSAFISNSLHLDVHEALSRLQAPVIAVWGREGILTPSEASSTFKRVNPNIEMRIFDKCSFQLQEEQASSFNALVREFATAKVK